MRPETSPLVLKAIFRVSIASWVLILLDSLKETIFLANKSKIATTSGSYDGDKQRVLGVFPSQIWPSQRL